MRGSCACETGGERREERRAGTSSMWRRGEKRANRFPSEFVINHYAFDLALGSSTFLKT